MPSNSLALANLLDRLRGRVGSKRPRHHADMRMKPEALESRRMLAAAGAEPSITGTVFVDNDLNGAFTAGEQLEGVTLQLFEDDGDGIFEPGTEDFQVTVDPLTEGITDVNGVYCFNDLSLDSEYFVVQPEQTVDGIVLQEMISGVIAPAEPDILIDDFEDPTASTPSQREVVANPTTPSVAGSLTLADETHILGREREYLAELISGVGEVAARIDRFDEGLLRFETTAGVEGRITMTWDATDSDPNGLDGIDLTAGGTLTGISIMAGVDLSGAGEQVRVVLHNGADTIEALGDLPVTDGGVAEGHIFLPFTAFSAGTFTADDVDGIQLFIGEGSEAIDGQIEYIGVIGPETVNVLNNPGTDLAITKSNSIASAVPGETISYTITVENLGPNDASGAQVIDDFDPATFTDVTYTSEAFDGASGNTVSGSGNIDDTVDLPDGSSIVYTVTGTVLSSATGTAENTASVISPNDRPDPNPDNNTDQEQDPLDVQVDLSITKDDGETTVTPGSQITYTIVASNGGPSDVVGATITDVFPAELTNVSFTSSTTGGATGNTATSNADISEINETVDMPVGSTITYIVTATVSSAATPGTFTNDVNIAAPSGTTELDDSDNMDSDTNEIGDVVDLQITKDDGVTSVAPGEELTYTIVVTNAGPSDVVDAIISDTFPVELQNVSFTSSVTGVVSGNTSGSGDILDTVSMEAGSMITYSVTGTVASDATGTISNTASVAAPSGVFESDTTNNQATDEDDLVSRVDLQITKVDDADQVTAGGTVTYTITATNAGPSDVIGATITDQFPSEFVTVDYVSSASGGASGNTASGSGDINDTVSMPAGSSVEYVVTAVLDVSASGSISNTATVTAPQGVVESDVTNNVDDEPVTVIDQTVDLSISKTDNETNVSPGDVLNYIITVENEGTADVTGATVTDAFPEGLSNVSYTSTVVSGTVTGNSASGNGDISDTVNLTAGAILQYDVTATVADSAADTISNTANVSVANDINTANNEATDVDTVVPVVDLQITKTDNQTEVSDGQILEYVITVINNGPSDVVGATVTDTFPSDLTNITWTSVASGGASGNDASGTDDINDVVDMPSGSTVVYNVTATVSTTNSQISNTASVSAPSGVTESNSGNNSATDLDTLDTALASLGGFVYFDENDDGVFDASETPLSDVDIVLLQNGQEIDRVSTDSDGAYLFDDLDPGTYVVREEQPSLFVDGQETVGGGIGTITDNDEFTVELAAGDNATELNFGESMRRPSKRDLLASNFAN